MIRRSSRGKRLRRSSETWRGKYRRIWCETLLPGSISFFPILRASGVSRLGGCSPWDVHPASFETQLLATLCWKAPAPRPHQAHTEHCGQGASDCDDVPPWPSQGWDAPPAHRGHMAKRPWERTRPGPEKQAVPPVMGERNAGLQTAVSKRHQCQRAP